MSIEAYLMVLDARVAALEGLIISWAMEREVDSTLGRGFIKGRALFVDGSRLEFSEQLPVERQKYRLHYMSANGELLVRWDSAPHHREVSTFPHHRHTPLGVQAHGPITLLEALDEIALRLRV
jgi:hypothetical protein